MASKASMSGRTAWSFCFTWMGQHSFRPSSPDCCLRGTTHRSSASADRRKRCRLCSDGGALPRRRYTHRGQRAASGAQTSPRVVKRRLCRAEIVQRMDSKLILEAARGTIRAGQAIGSPANCSRHVFNRLFTKGQKKISGRCLRMHQPEEHVSRR